MSYLVVLMPRWVYTVAWIVWAVWFLVWEILAIIDEGENETLSGHVKQLLWQGDSNRPTIAAFVLLPLLVWLAYHFYVETKDAWTT